MAGKGQKYPKEFKDSAIQLVLNSQKSVIKIADELGVHEKTLDFLHNLKKKEEGIIRDEKI